MEFNIPKAVELFFKNKNLSLQHLTLQAGKPLPVAHVCACGIGIALGKRVDVMNIEDEFLDYRQTKSGCIFSSKKRNTICVNKPNNMEIEILAEVR